MQGSFTIEDFVAHLRARWRFPAIVCASAAAAAVVITLLLPERYTATTRIVVEAAAGSDLRTPQAVSAQYIEMLKTYEQFASSDRLFMDALDRFELRATAPGRAVEQWKRRVLEVAMVGATKVLEIRVTLPDPATAQAMAQYLAEQTVELSARVNQEADQKLIDEAQLRRDHVRKELDEIEAEWTRILREQPVEDLASRVDGLELRQASLERNIVDLQAKGAASSASLQNLIDQRTSVEKELAQASAELGRRRAARERATDRRAQVRAQYQEAQRQLDAAFSTAGYRGERLQLIDPGIVPEQPSSPNLALNVIAAGMLGLFLSLAAVTVQFALRTAPVQDAA